VPANNDFNFLVSELGVDPLNCNPTCRGDSDTGVRRRDCSGDEGVNGLSDGLLSLETGDDGDLIPIDDDVDGLSLCSIIFNLFSDDIITIVTLSNSSFSYTIQCLTTINHIYNI